MCMLACRFATTERLLVVLWFGYVWSSTFGAHANIKALFCPHCQSVFAKDAAAKAARAGETAKDIAFRTKGFRKPAAFPQYEMRV